MDSSPIQGLILFAVFILLNFITYCFGEASQNINEAELNSLFASDEAFNRENFVVFEINLDKLLQNQWNIKYD